MLHKQNTYHSDNTLPAMSVTKKKGAMKAVSAKEQAELIDIIVKGKAQSIPKLLRSILVARGLLSGRAGGPG